MTETQTYSGITPDAVIIRTSIADGLNHPGDLMRQVGTLRVQKTYNTAHLGTIVVKINSLAR